MKANYNHMNRMNRSNIASKQIRRTIRINRHRMELRPDDPPDIRRVLDQLDQQIQDHTEPEPPIMTVSQLYASKLEPTSGTYAITNQDDMDALLQYCKAGRNTKGVTFTILGTKTYDVDKVYCQVTLKSDSDTNSPIIQSGTGFEGTLEGNNAIINLNISDTSLSSVGMFGAIGVSGTVKDLILTGKVEAGANADAVGALAGYNSGIIDNVIVTDDITVTAPDSYNVGGIAGFNDGFYEKHAHGTIRNSANQGTVTGYEKVGGITGENSGLIGSCSNTGTIRAMSVRRSGVGGIAGRNGNNNTAVEIGTILDCCNLAPIFGGTYGLDDDETGEDKAKLGQWVGGICGFQNSLSKCGFCYNTGVLRGYSRVHSIIGENDNTAVTEVDGKQIIQYKGIKNCYGLMGQVKSYMDQDMSDGSETLPEDVMKDLDEENKKMFLNLLNDYPDGTQYWEQTQGEYPTLVPNAFKETAPDASGETEVKEVYLDTINESASDEDVVGSAGNPYHTLAEAVAGANAGGTVYLMNPVSLDQSTGLYDSVTFKRGFKDAEDSDADQKQVPMFEGPMFEVDIPNVTEKNSDTGKDEPALGYLTMTTATIDGGGIGTLFHVTHGRLRLRGDITLKNCETAVSVNGQGPAADLLNAQVEVNYATIEATGNAIELANANSDFILDAFNAVSITGTIYLGTGSYITVAAAIPCKLDVVSAVNTYNTVIAKGTAQYPLVSTDIDELDMPGHYLMLNSGENKIVMLY